MNRNQLTQLVLMVVQPGLLPARRRHHDERGLSQSTENAVLLAGAVAIAMIVIAAVTSYVSGHMPK